MMSTGRASLRPKAQMQIKHVSAPGIFAFRSLHAKIGALLGVGRSECVRTCRAKTLPQVMQRIATAPTLLSAPRVWDAEVQVALAQGAGVRTPIAQVRRTDLGPILLPSSHFIGGGYERRQTLHRTGRWRG